MRKLADTVLDVMLWGVIILFGPYAIYASVAFFDALFNGPR